MPRVKWQEREAYGSPPSVTEVKMVELYLHSPFHLHGVVLNELINKREEVTL
jgi:hypothetical protein